MTYVHLLFIVFYNNPIFSELAAQIQDQFNAFGAFMNIKTALIVGGYGLHSFFSIFVFFSFNHNHFQIGMSS